MKFILGITYGVIFTAILAATLHDYPDIGIVQKLPEWGQTIGTIIAVFVAVWIAHKDRLDARRDSLDQEITQRRRLVAAIRVEIRAIMGMAELHRKTAIKSLPEIKKARVEGKLKNQDKPPLRTITFGDRQIYKAVSQWIGTLPEAVVAQIVSFYTLIYNVEELAASSTSVEEMLENLIPHYPRVLVGAEILLAQLIMYERSGCGQAANLFVPPAFLEQVSNKYDYPINEAMKAFAYHSNPAPNQ